MFLGFPQVWPKQSLPNMKLHVVKSVDNRGLMFPMVPDTGKKTPRGLPHREQCHCRPRHPKRARELRHRSTSSCRRRS